MQMDEQAAVRYLAAHAKKKVAGVAWECDFESALILVGAWQFALRHPSFGDSPTGRHCRYFCEAFIDRMADGDEIVRGLLWRGFDAAHDVRTRPLPNSPVVVREGKFLRLQAFVDAVRDDEQIRETMAMLKVGHEMGDDPHDVIRRAILSFVLGVFDPATRQRLFDQPPNTTDHTNGHG